MAIVLMVSSVSSTGCQRAEAAKPMSTTPIPHTVKVIRYGFYSIAPIAVPSKLASGLQTASSRNVRAYVRALRTRLGWRPIAV
jgi:hypothetical protein